MSYPAYMAFSGEPDLTLTSWRVYMTLQPPFLDFVEPRPVKIELLHEALKFQRKRQHSVGRQHVRAAVVWLIARGYLVECGRDSRGVRLLRLAYAVERPATTPTQRTA